MTAVPEYNLALDELSIALSFATGVVIGAAPTPVVKAPVAAPAPAPVAPEPKVEAKKVCRVPVLRLNGWMT